jgi:hypothetical protein
LSVFDRFGIRYLIVGGIAVGYHAEPRFTKDLDVLVAIGEFNYLQFYAALQEYGTPLQTVRPEEFLSEDFVFFFGIPPWRIDILTSIPGVDFELAYADRVSFALGHKQVDCISRQWLIRAKEASGRPQDLADLEALRQADNFQT